MRQVYSSPRVENVERVVALLEEAGVATRVVNRDKLNRDRFQRFSYQDAGDSRGWPAVQIVSAEDLPKARELLRASGLMGSTRPDAEPAMPRWEAPGNTPDYMAKRMRRAAMIGVLFALMFLAYAYSTSDISTRRPVPVQAPAAVAPPVEDNIVILLDDDASDAEGNTESEEPPR